jgi:hypothetical protein
MGYPFADTNLRYCILLTALHTVSAVFPRPVRIDVSLPTFTSVKASVSVLASLCGLVRHRTGVPPDDLSLILGSLSVSLLVRLLTY